MVEDSGEPRVAVYFDVENLLVSHYDHVHGKGAWRRDGVLSRQPVPEVPARLRAAAVSFDAVLDFAASIGVVTISRAYANWSAVPYAACGPSLNRRAVDLVQLFPLSGTKNGSDIRLATDVIDDLMLYPHLTHVLVAAGDSDYVPVAQKARRLGKRVVGVGVEGSSSAMWEAACDEFRRYGTLVEANDATTAVEPSEPEGRKERVGPESPAALLARALRLEHRRTGEDWVSLSQLKNLMLRLSPGFDEGSEHRSFSAFVRAHPEVAIIGDQNRQARLAELGPP